MFVLLFLNKFSQIANRTPSEWGIQFVNILIIAVTLVVVAVPEGVHPLMSCYDVYLITVKVCRLPLP
jgi:hypothetical protein